MATLLKPADDRGDDLLAVVEAAALDDDGEAAREHLAAGHAIYYSDADWAGEIHRGRPTSVGCSGPQYG